LTKDGVDGKAFHTLTRTCDRPFDEMFMKMMDETAVYMCKNVQGAQFAFVQSDEISILVTDFDKCTTDAWFDYNVQKMCSIGASLATAKFNSQYRESPNCIGMANFDCRVFVVPDPVEVENYFIWRQQDASRNSIQMVARSYYSHKELMNKTTPELHEMIYAEGDNWDNYPIGCKRGRLVVYDSTLVVVDPDVLALCIYLLWRLCEHK